MVLMSEYQLNLRNGGMVGLPGGTRGTLRETNDDGSSGRPCGQLGPWDSQVCPGGRSEAEDVSLGREVQAELQGLKKVRVCCGRRGAFVQNLSCGYSCLVLWKSLMVLL